jgi:hypothetical protein
MKTFKHYLSEMEDLREAWWDDEDDDEEDNTSNSGNNTARSLNTPTPPNSFIPTHFHIPYVGGKIPLMMAKPGEFWEKTNKGMKLFLPPDMKASDLKKETKPGILQNYSVDGEYAPDGKLTWKYKDNETWFNGLEGITRTFWTPERVGYVPQQSTASASTNNQSSSPNNDEGFSLLTRFGDPSSTGSNTSTDYSFLGNTGSSGAKTSPVTSANIQPQPISVTAPAANPPAANPPAANPPAANPPAANPPAEKPTAPAAPAEKPAASAGPKKEQPPAPAAPAGPKKEPAPAPAGPKKEQPPPAPDRKSKIEELQKVLKTEGYYNGPINGIESDDLRDALKKYDQGKTKTTSKSSPESVPTSTPTSAPPYVEILDRVEKLRKKYSVPESKSTIDSPVEQMQRIRQLIDVAESRDSLGWVSDAEPLPKKTPTIVGGTGKEPIVNLDVRNPPAGTPSSGVWSKIKNVPGVNATGKLVGRVAPGAGVALGALDVANRYQAGDTTGAAIAGATAAASSIPVIGTAAAILGTSVQALRDKIRTGKLLPNEEEILAAVAKDSEEKKDMAQLQKDLKDLQGYLNDRSIGPVTKIDIETAIGRINKILKQR